jgi:hypothetical protein
MRFLAISFLLVALMAQMGGADNSAVLKLGQVFGSVGFFEPQSRWSPE